jgi:hypothetical protein
MRRLIPVFAVLFAFVAAAPASADVTPPPIKHVFVIVLENKGYS